MINDAAGSDFAKKNILICDTQPVAVEGMRWLIENSGDLRFAGSVHSLAGIYAVLNPAEPPAETEDTVIETLMAETSEADSERSAFVSDLCAISDAIDSWREPVAELAAGETIPAIQGPISAVVIDKGLGLVGVMDLLQKLASSPNPTPAVVWGTAITESEALRLLQAGARGIVRRTSESGRLLDCLRAVTAGGTWMEDGIFGSTEKIYNPRRSQLTTREREVVVLVEKGLRNRDIARMLGIQTGTVKIHLKHIFEKTGVRGRYGLAFTGLQSKGSIAQTEPQRVTA
jgi:DNA-binding NarL/FixJ family response regulator